MKCSSISSRRNTRASPDFRNRCATWWKLRWSKAFRSIQTASPTYSDQTANPNWIRRDSNDRTRRAHSEIICSTEHRFRSPIRSGVLPPDSAARLSWPATRRKSARFRPTPKIPRSPPTAAQPLSSSSPPESSITIALPTMMPIIPPVPVSVIASNKNCQVMSRLRAPIALRTPISRVRSVTETSMMFITPIPPISSPIELSTTTASTTPKIMSLNCFTDVDLRLHRKIVGLVVRNVSPPAQHFAHLVHSGIQLPRIRQDADRHFEARRIKLGERVVRNHHAPIFVVVPNSPDRLFKHADHRKFEPSTSNFLAERIIEPGEKAPSRCLRRCTTTFVAMRDFPRR